VDQRQVPGASGASGARDHGFHLVPWVVARAKSLDGWDSILQFGGKFQGFDQSMLPKIDGLFHGKMESRNE
jgi:hypothetical protein